MDTALQGASLTRPASPAAIGAAIAAQQDRLEQIPLDRIHPSATNPRKTFEGIEDLAASIAVQGLLQPIVVRPMKKDGEFEILAGERRFRALKHLKRETAPCKVTVATDGEARAIQIVENLQREDIKPMEEAKAFAQLQDLDHKFWTPQVIAKAIGKTDRFVQQRIQMARNLSPKAQKAVAEGELKIEFARTLAIAPKPIQDKLLDEIDDWEWQSMSVDTLRENILDEMVPVDLAAFDLADYKGGFHEEGKKRFFTDVEQFNHLQHKAAEALVAKLKVEWPKAQLIEDKDSYRYCWGDTGDGIRYGSDGKKRATGGLKVGRDILKAVVWIEQGRVKSAEGVALEAAFPKASRAGGVSGGSSGPARETAEHKRYRHAYNEAVFEAVAAKPAFALRVLLCRFIDGTTRFTYDHNEAKRGHEAILPKELLAFFDKPYHSPNTVKLWEVVKKLKDDDVAAMVAKYTARSLSWQFGPSWQGGNKKPPEFTALLATETKAKLPEKVAAKKPAKAKGKVKPKATAKKAAAKTRKKS